MMRVIVEALGTLGRYLPPGTSRVEMNVDEGCTVEGVLLKLGMDLDEPWNASLNGTLARPREAVTEGSVLLVFPPITGGS